MPARRRRDPRERERSTVAPSAQLAGFIAKFEPAMAARIRACRRVLRKRFPTANELVYDNYNFFVIGYSTTLRPSHTIVSLVANAKSVGLSFYYGASLPDPHGLLLGSGTQNRFVRLRNAASLDEPALAAVIRTAIAQADPPLARSGGGELVIRSVSRKQRPRRLGVSGHGKASRISGRAGAD